MESKEMILQNLQHRLREDENEFRRLYTLCRDGGDVDGSHQHVMGRLNAEARAILDAIAAIQADDDGKFTSCMARLKEMGVC